MTTETTSMRAPRFFYMRDGRRTLTVAYQTSSGPNGSIGASGAYSINRIDPNSKSDSFSKRTGRGIAIGRLTHSTRDIKRTFRVCALTMRELHIAIAETIAESGIDQAAREVARAYLARR